MATVKVLGNSFTITSGVKQADWDSVSKYAPRALTLYGGEDGKQAVFRVGFSGGSVTKHGISFDSVTRGEGSYATITLPLDFDGSDISGYIADLYGTAIADLQKVEAQVREALPGIEDARNKVLEAISVIE